MNRRLGLKVLLVAIVICCAFASASTYKEYFASFPWGHGSPPSADKLSAMFGTPTNNTQCQPPNIKLSNGCFASCPKGTTEKQIDGSLTCSDPDFKITDGIKCSNLSCGDNTGDLDKNRTTCTLLSCPPDYKQAEGQCVLKEVPKSYYPLFKQKCATGDRATSAGGGKIACVKCPTDALAAKQLKNGDLTCIISPDTKTTKTVPALCGNTPITDTKMNAYDIFSTYGGKIVNELDNQGGTHDYLLCNYYDKNTNICYSKACGGKVVDGVCYKTSTKV